MENALLTFVVFSITLSTIAEVQAIQQPHQTAQQGQEPVGVLSLPETFNGLDLAADTVSDDMRIYAQIKSGYGANPPLDEPDFTDTIRNVMEVDDFYKKLSSFETKLIYMRLMLAAQAVALATENLYKLPLARQLFFITKESKALDQRQMELRQASKDLEKIKGLKRGKYEEMIAMAHHRSQPVISDTMHGRLQERAPDFILPIAATALVATIAVMVMGVYVRQNKL